MPFEAIFVNWKKMNAKRIAKLIVTSQFQNKVQKDMNLEQIENVITKFFMNDEINYICVYEGKSLRGILVLYPSDGITVQINPGMTLGGHPIVQKSVYCDQISRILMEKAIEWINDSKFLILELSIPWDMDSDQNYYEKFIYAYKNLGFEVKLRYVEMEYLMRDHMMYRLKEPDSIKITSLFNFNEEELYNCYLAAFQKGGARFFNYQDEKGKEEYFKDLGYPNEIDEDYSIALASKNQLIGFSFVLPYDNNYEEFHISCMCIHPSFMNKGYGKMMLKYILDRLHVQNAQKVSLGTEPTMKAFRLYHKFGFEVKEGTIIFRKERM